MTVITHEISLDNFHKQIRFVLESYKPHGLNVSEFKNVVICGLGGSGIGGRIAKLISFSDFKIPIEVVSDYVLPGYANEHTLVILSSYSGNTEETLAMFDAAKKNGCKILATSSGGFLTKFCEQGNYPCYLVEKGYQPRMALGFSLSFLLLILGELQGHDLKDSLLSIANNIENNADLKKEAKELMDCFQDTLNNKFVIVCDMAFEAVAIRICQQIQENAKCEAFISVLPESNHNMIESYYGKQETNFIFLNSGINSKVAQRFEYLTNLLNSAGAKIYAMPAKEFNLLSIFRVIHATDWFSILLSNARQVDNMTVPNIAKLKLFLDEKQG